MTGLREHGVRRFGIAHFFVALALMPTCGLLTVIANGQPIDSLQDAQKAYQDSDYPKAIQLAAEAANANPQDPKIQLLLTKAHLESQQYDAAIRSAERAVALDPKNSVYHEWLGRAYGEKADHSSFMSALGFAKKTRKEFQAAVELDGQNFTARQAVIEFDCAAPAMAGGGEDKARPEIAQMAQLDVAEGHYAEANCRRQKKDLPAADAGFKKALQANLNSEERVFDVGDYAVRRNDAEMLLTVATLGARLGPNDPRPKFYRAVALVLKKQSGADAENLLREYLKEAPARSGYPRPTAVHYWLGQAYESEKDEGAARAEYETALKLDSKNKNAQEALKRLKKG
jgi:tetratricopeptide (TPR) repeat protein